MTHPVSARGTNSLRLALYPLTFVDEGDEVVIGRPDIDSFAVFPADSAAVLRRLGAGDDLASVAAWYEATYGEPADIDEFVGTLRELDFIRPDGEDEAEVPVAVPVRWRRLGGIVFSLPALMLYAVAGAGAVWLMVAVPALTPGPAKVYFTRSLLVVIGVTCVGQLTGIAWHEWFHVLAGRRLGLASTISVGRRLYFVVFQTTLAGLMGVPARRRILPFCAGLIADALFIAALTGLAEVGRETGWPPWLIRVAVCLVYLTILRMLWQALIFMETDLYHVLASALRCPDLHQMTVAYLRNRYLRWRGRPELAADESGWTARTARTVRRYALVVIFGSAIMIVLAAIAVIPILAGLIVRAYHGVATGQVDSGWFWDSALAGTAALAQFVIAGALAVRDHRRRLAATGPDR